MPAQADASSTTADRAYAKKIRPDLLLLAICAIAAIPRLYLGLTEFVEYDGFWHVFIAQQDTWKNFWWEYMHNDHPLLFYLMLKVLVHFGRSVLLYRAISILCGVGTVYMVGRIAGKLSSSRFATPLTALAFGLAMPAIEISVSVRSYMLSVFFVVLSFYYFLDLLPIPGVVPSRRARIWFAATAVLAVSSEYCAFFYVVACAFVLVLFLLKQRPIARERWIACGLTFLPIALVMWVLYASHIHFNRNNMGHLSQYLYQKGEPRLKFFARNLHDLFNFLSPWQIADRRHFEKVAGMLAAGAIGITATLRSRAVAPLLMLFTILGELVLAGFLDRYPFGGLMRQQFLLLPFVVLSAGICLDRLLALAPGRKVAAAIAGIAAVAILAVSAHRFNLYPKIHEELFTREMRLFDAAVPSARAVYTDQYNLIVFFTHHHQWIWRFSGKLPMATWVEEYTLEHRNQKMLLLRDKTRWNLDFLDPGLFRDLATSLRTTRLPTLAVFCIHQVPGSQTPEQQEMFQRNVFALASAEHLQVRRFLQDGLNVYAEFALSARASAL